DLPVLVDGTIDIPPRAVDLDVGLVHEPAVTRCVPSKPGRVGQQRGEPLHPSEHADVVNLDATLDQQFLDVAVREVVAQVPPDRHHDDLGREPEASERRCRRQSRARTDRHLHQPSLADLANDQRNRPTNHPFPQPRHHHWPRRTLTRSCKLSTSTASSNYTTRYTVTGNSSIAG